MQYEISKEVRTAFVVAFSDKATAQDTAPGMTCSETDAMASMLIALGAPESVREWLSAHEGGLLHEGETHSV
ncbi:hypothetical protein [Streptomyces sp. NPDC055036]